MRKNVDGLQNYECVTECPSVHGLGLHRNCACCTLHRMCHHDHPAVHAAAVYDALPFLPGRHLDLSRLFFVHDAEVELHPWCLSCMCTS
jgi:hypothetical protein